MSMLVQINNGTVIYSIILLIHCINVIKVPYFSSDNRHLNYLHYCGHLLLSLLVFRLVILTSRHSWWCCGYHCPDQGSRIFDHCGLSRNPLHCHCTCHHIVWITNYINNINLSIECTIFMYWNVLLTSDHKLFFIVLEYQTLSRKFLVSYWSTENLQLFIY